MILGIRRKIIMTALLSSVLVVVVFVFCLQSSIDATVGIDQTSIESLTTTCSDIDRQKIINSLSGTKIYSHDNGYTSIDGGLIQREFARLANDGVTSCSEVYGFIRGVQAAYSAILNYEVNNAVVANNKVDYDPDHWFEVNLANVMLFDNSEIPGQGSDNELLPGRLFSTRMPRNVDTSADSVANFTAQITEHNVQTVVVLVETSELGPYGSSTLLDLYATLGVNVIHYPIVDYTAPTLNTGFTDLLQSILLLLAKNNNVLVHCAGGTGRTGLVLSTLVKSVGIKDPIAWVRRVKSTYVETMTQENFVASVPPLFDDRLTQLKPLFAKAVVVEQLIQLFIRDKDISLHSNDNSNAANAAINTVFALIDTDNSQTISTSELESLFNSVGANAVTPALFQKISAPYSDGEITQLQFINMMSISAMNSKSC
jgi:hypothetical protein